MPSSLCFDRKNQIVQLFLLRVDDVQQQETVADAFRDCANLTQIRLPKNCQIDPAAFDHPVYVFAPSDGTTKQCCDAQSNLIFVETN